MTDKTTFPRRWRASGLDLQDSGAQIYGHVCTTSEEVARINASLGLDAACLVLVDTWVRSAFGVSGAFVD
jgi:hypothetical protein